MIILHIVLCNNVQLLLFMFLKREYSVAILLYIYLRHSLKIHICLVNFIFSLNISTCLYIIRLKK